MYSLLGESGDLHPPKDSNRNEIALTTQEEHDIRAQVLSDAMALAQRGAPLSPAWYRQLGDGAAAQMAEARLDNLSTAPAPAAGKRRRWDTYEVEAIVNEERGWYLVRWAGYHPSWNSSLRNSSLRVTSLRRTSSCCLRWRHSPADTPRSWASTQAARGGRRATAGRRRSASGS